MDKTQKNTPQPKEKRASEQQPSDRRAMERRAMEHYERGRALWAEGRRGEAMTEYNESLARYPEGPARTALTIADDIMNFYNKDLYNP